MKVEESREDGELVVRAELPGVDPEKDVEVSVSDGVLHISAKREERKETKGKRSYRSEFRYGQLSRDLMLPTEVDPGEVDAKYKDGILEIRVPCKDEEPVKSTKVPISRS
jgi:HSP20 family protein